MVVLIMGPYVRLFTAVVFISSVSFLDCSRCPPAALRWRYGPCPPRRASARSPLSYEALRVAPAGPYHTSHVPEEGSRACYHAPSTPAVPGSQRAGGPR